MQHSVSISYKRNFIRRLISVQIIRLSFRCFILRLDFLSPPFQSCCSVSPTLCDPWPIVHQASLSFTSYQSLLKLMSIELVMPSNYLILCHPLSFLLSFPASRSFPMSRFFAPCGKSIGVSASASVLPMNIQG